MRFAGFRLIIQATRKFNKDQCWTSAIVISYFALLCSIPLIALFFFISSKLLGNTELALKSLNLFTEEFFARLEPDFIHKLQGLSSSVSRLGPFGLVGSVISVSFLFSSLISTINRIFKVNLKRSFFYNRLLEYLLMCVVGILTVLSLAITAIWTTLSRILKESSLVASYLNPDLIDLVNNFFIRYLIPYALTFCVFYILFKLIPEIKIYKRAALISAAISAFLFELFKKVFAFYVVHFSALGVVVNKILQGTLASIIFFLLWITFSLVITLWGAELTAVINESITGLPLKQNSGQPGNSNTKNSA